MSLISQSGIDLLHRRERLERCGRLGHVYEVLSRSAWVWPCNGCSGKRRSNESCVPFDDLRDREINSPSYLLENISIHLFPRPISPFTCQGVRVAAPKATAEMNQYWIPHLDIHKQVITRELQYYLGPDATVRPFTHKVSSRRLWPAVL
jgi:hypothetical protein